ncbi:MAG: FAD-dependent oxidoreductase [Paracoccaceae bacterium]
MSLRRLYPAASYAPRPDPGNFWQSTVERPEPSAALEGDIRADVAIIGAGVTGLNAARMLAKGGLDVVVLDAAWPGWGASGRAGGFVCMGGSKLDNAALIKRFGLTEARAFVAAQTGAVAQVRALLKTEKIHADAHGNGEWAMAHRASDAAGFADEAAFLKASFGIQAEVFSQPQLAERGLASPAFFGALHHPVGFALNPLKYTLGLARAATQAGARIFGGSPVMALHAGAPNRLVTPHGSVSARHVIIATNGYSADGLASWMDGRFLPVPSNIIVTRVLSAAEQKAQGWRATEPVSDTRNLLHYFRLMPDGRMMFGMRGGTNLRPADTARMQRRIRRDFNAIFPAWAHVETPYFWSGLVCMNRSLTAYVGPVPGYDHVWSAHAFQGAGLAMGTWSGQALAEIILGNKSPQSLPAPLREVPAKFPFPTLRRRLLGLAYARYGWRDR